VGIITVRIVGGNFGRMPDTVGCNFALKFIKRSFKMFPNLETLEALRWFDSISDGLPYEGQEHLKTLRLAVFAQQPTNKQSTPLCACGQLSVKFFCDNCFCDEIFDATKESRA
jgi:CDGSH-type Zn-finger protein